MSKENICGKFYAFFVLRFTKGKVVLFVLRFTTFRFGDYILKNQNIMGERKRKIG